MFFTFCGCRFISEERIFVPVVYSLLGGSKGLFPQTFFYEPKEFFTFR
ncbi:hypothetical protein RV08_GL001704 [Enterococcus mundtii]|nr:hypothetical protein RV08_GL001704 [Enterococcus mundtii]